MIRAIVFDVDGVLVKPMVFTGVLERDYGLTIDDTSAFFQGPLKECLVGNADLKAELPRFLTDWRWPHSLDNFIAQWFEADSTTNVEMLGLANAVRKGGLACYVASTQEQHRASYLENQMGFKDVFDRLFFSCHLGCQKPQREFYELVSSQIAVHPSETLFFDDRPENVVGARAAGWQAEEYRFGGNLSGILEKYGIAWDGA